LPKIFAAAAVFRLLLCPLRDSHTIGLAFISTHSAI
jgi:hypothetical protein